MMRKTVCMVIAVGLMLVLSANAAATERGRIRIHLDPGELEAHGGEMTLYYVGTPIEEGYRITAEFGGGIVYEEDALSSQLAQFLSRSEQKVGIKVALDPDGKGEYVGLPDGLYLLEQTAQIDGYYPMISQMVEMPCDGNRNILISPELKPFIALSSPATGDPASPLLWAMVLVLSGMGLYLCVDSRKNM